MIRPRHRLWMILGLMGAFALTPTLAQAAREGLAIQLTHGISIDPSIAPLGDRMVYVTVVAGKEQLFVAQVDGSHPRQLTHDDVDHEDPAWSPDGKKVAFVRVEAGQQVLYVMNINGSGATPITQKDEHVIHPHWAPDGLAIIYCTSDDLAPPAKNTADVYRMDIQSHRATKLISGGINTYASLSPDGRKIAFRRIIGDMNSEVFVADADGSNVHNISNHWAFDGWPAWSPDGTQIAFASNRSGNYQIYVMKPDGSDVRRVANTEGRATAPTWSPNGKAIYFPNCHRNDYGSDCQIYVAESLMH